MNTDPFDYLKKFKKLPSYQFERRIDVFILPYLEQVFNEENKVDDFVFVYPEFPLQRTSSDPNLKSKLCEYADYLMWSRKLNTVFLVEFKTDSNSITEKQFVSYVQNCKFGWEALMTFYVDKSIKNQSWRKFVYGIDLIYQTSPSLTGLNDPSNFKVFYENKNGKRVNEALRKLRSSMSFLEEPNVRFTYIAPASASKKIEGFINSHPEANTYYSKFISLGKFASSTSEPLQSVLTMIE